MNVLDSAFGGGADHRTLLETVTSRIRELIVQGNLPPNLPLRPQALASRLSVSVMPVREALRLLEAEGPVSFTPRRQPSVTYQTPNPWDDALASHEAILRACQAHDAGQAERVTREHTEAACDRLLQALRTRARTGAPATRRAPRH